MILKNRKIKILKTRYLEMGNGITPTLKTIVEITPIRQHKRYGTIRWEEQLTIMKYLKPIIKSKFLAYND